jgi:peroxiredoxin
MCFARKLWFLLILLSIAGCGDNLIPSGQDKRPPVQSGTNGSAVGQTAPGLTETVTDTNGNPVTFSNVLAAKKGIVLYFTMWCPSCDSQTSILQESIVPQFPNVGFYLVDYVSGTVADAAGAATANGYAGGVFTIIADTSHFLLNGYQGTMGTTVVIDSTGIIRMNEDFKDGSRLQAALAVLP